MLIHTGRHKGKREEKYLSCSLQSVEFRVYRQSNGSYRNRKIKNNDISLQNHFESIWDVSLLQQSS